MYDVQDHSQECTIRSLCALTYKGLQDAGVLVRSPNDSFDLTGMKIYQDIHERDLVSWKKLGGRLHDGIYHILMSVLRHVS